MSTQGETRTEWIARYTERSKYLAETIRPIEMALDECDRALATGILDVPGGGVSARAVAAYCLACLAHALQALSNEGMRITFNDEVAVARKDRSAGDITDLISACRGAACHYGSDSRRVDGGPMLYIDPIHGRKGISFGSADAPPIAVGCDHEDDCAICFGSLRIYRDRHIRRALKEAREAVEDYRTKSKAALFK